MSNCYDSFDEDEGFGWVVRALLDWRLNEEGCTLAWSQRRSSWEGMCVLRDAFILLFFNVCAVAAGSLTSVSVR